MNNEKLKKVLLYAQRTVQHPDTPHYGIITTDGFHLKSSSELRAMLESRLKLIEEYEMFEKDIQELLTELT